VYLERVNAFCHQNQDYETLLKAKQSLFAPFFLDVYSMMELVHEMDIVNNISNVRNDYIQAMKKGCSLTLADYLSMKDLTSLIQKYKLKVSEYLSLLNVLSYEK
jgi:hypothetical protein